MSTLKYRRRFTGFLLAGYQITVLLWGSYYHLTTIPFSIGGSKKRSHHPRCKRRVHFTLSESMPFDPSNLRLYPRFLDTVIFFEKTLSGLGSTSYQSVWIAFFPFQGAESSPLSSSFIQLRKRDRKKDRTFKDPKESTLRCRLIRSIWGCILDLF